MAFSSVVKNLAMAAAGAALLALGVAGKAQAGTFIDTTPGWDPSAGPVSSAPFGEGPLSTIGQTFTVGSDNVLNELSFWLVGYPESPTTDFAAYVMEWDSANSRATGDILYQSGMQSTTPWIDNGDGLYELDELDKFVFNTGGIALTSGQQYVAFLSASNFFDGVGDISASLFGADVYDGGSAVAQDNGSDFSALTAQEWFSAPWDLTFQASFSGASASVPEPSSMLGLLAFGTLGTGSLLKRKHQKA